VVVEGFEEEAEGDSGASRNTLPPPERRIVVSEPLIDLSGAWKEVPESSHGVVEDGEEEVHPFRPVRTGIRG
jgi:hypothetical protein